MTSTGSETRRAGTGVRDHPAWSIASLALLAGMTVLHVAMGLNASGHADMLRDIYWAQQIVAGAAYPLAGPPIFDTISLGPWWYYLMAIPLWAMGSVVAVPVTILGLASAKYWLAWWLGRRIRGAAFGLLFAVSLLYCGWSTVPVLFPTHTALVEATVLLLGLNALGNLERWNPARAGLLGLIAGLNLNAHPTTALFVLAAGAVVLWRWRDLRSWALLGLSVLIAAAMLMPPLLDPVVVTDPGLQGLARYAANDIQGVQPGRFVAVLAGIVLWGPWNSLMLTTRWSPGTVHAVWLMFMATVLFALAGLPRLRVRDRPLLRLCAAAAGLLLAQAAFLTLVRSTTSIWMGSAAIPCLAFLLACGWWAWLQGGRIVHAIALSALALFAVISLAPNGLFLRRLHSVRAMVGPDAYFDIVHRTPGFETLPHTMLNLRDLERASALVCGGGVVHGLLGVGLEQTLGTTLVSACGSSRGFRFGGKDDDGVHLAGWDRDTWEDVGIVPEVGDGDYGWTRRVRAIAPDTGQGPAAPGWRQLHPSMGDTEARAETFEFETGARDVVFVTNRFIHRTPMQVLEASAGGRPALRVHVGRSSSGFKCDGCDAGSTVQWRVRLQAAIDLADVYVVQAGQDAAAPASQ